MLFDGSVREYKYFVCLRDLRKHDMNQVLAICYLVFFGVVTAISTLNDFEILENGYPLWMIIAGVAIPALGAVSMTFYTFSYKPDFCAWVWKIVPFMLVVYYMVEWYFDFVVYKEPYDSPQLIGGATFLGSLLLLPLLYSSFKLGYSKNKV